VLAGAAAPAQSQELPPGVAQALARAQVPPDALSVVVQPVSTDGNAPPMRLQSQAHRPMNPASLFKLVTTAAALDLLGPAWSWTTPVWLQGPVHDGLLEGSLAIRGSGDPTLVLERVWLLLHRVRQSGVREIRGDIVLDHGAFPAPRGAPGDFDGEPLKPYNVQADALMLNYKTVTYTFTPDASRRVAWVSVDAPLARVRIDASVPLADGPCGDWRSALRASFDDPDRVRFAGRYVESCGERRWPVASADAAGYDARLVEGLWREMGGRLGGRVVDGPAPADVPPSFVANSPPLAEVVRDINKFSNNTMAQQLFLTLGATQRGEGSTQAAREVLHRWLAERFGAELAGEAVIDNGSGLSRDARLSALVLAQLLQSMWASPAMPELMSSLPVAGTDGTMRRTQAPAGRAHLKTGSLRDTAGLAGYVLGASGRRYVLVAMVNHPNAGAAHAALDALVQWTVDDVPAAPVVSH